jgi:hypothetical protein
VRADDLDLVHAQFAGIAGCGRGCGVCETHFTA